MLSCHSKHFPARLLMVSAPIERPLMVSGVGKRSALLPFGYWCISEYLLVSALPVKCSITMTHTFALATCCSQAVNSQ